MNPRYEIGQKVYILWNGTPETGVVERIWRGKDFAYEVEVDHDHAEYNDSRT